MSAPEDSALDALGDRCGISRRYQDYRKNWTEVSRDARLAVLAAMGFEPTEAAARMALDQGRHEAQRALPRTLLLRRGEPLSLAPNLPAGTAHWRLLLCLEDGEEQELPLPEAAATPPGLSLELDCPLGYHELRLYRDGELHCRCALLLAPRTSFQPAELERGERIFGVSVQLYSVRSARNWGMGDFTDLELLVRETAAQGAHVLGLNPLHALFPANPLHFSPYSPSNRAFLNVMYIDPQRLPNYQECETAQQMVADPEFQARLVALRETHHVEYAGVAQCKLPVLEALYRHFVQVHLGRDTAPDRALRAFIESRGEALRLHATYDALHEHFLRQDLNTWGWPVWPEAFRDPGSAAVAELAAEQAERIRYYQFLQWCAAEQLLAAQALARECGMAVGIYLDLAVGVDLNGSEVWGRQQAFCTRASAGAPPDELARSGQDWGFPPLAPDYLRSSAYAPFREVLRANMALCGAVRYDHAVSLVRLWWIPRSGDAADGAYVDYPLEDLLGVLALESKRNNCLVIGEDLGTVPEELTAMMQQNHLFSYRVLYFEKSPDAMIAPQDYPREAVATVTTHDLPTLASWWDGSDIDLRADLGLLGDENTIAEMREARVETRQQLLDALVAAGCWPHESDAAAIGELTTALNKAVHRFLARSRSAVMLAQVEDLMEMLAPINVPGTFEEHRNWQRKLRWPLEELFQHSAALEICDAMRGERQC